MTFVLLASLQLAQHLWQRQAGRLLYLTLLVALALYVPKYSALSSHNHVRIGFPGLKAPQLEYQWAAKLNHSVAPGSYVVAPPEISTWIPTFHHQAYPLRVRHYLKRSRAYLAPGELHVRRSMTFYVSDVKLPPQASAIFADGLIRFNIAGVCLKRSSRNEEARKILREKGFHKTEQDNRYEIWIR